MAGYDRAVGALHRQFLANAPWMMIVPGACIAFAAVALNLLGDGVAQAARRRARAIEL